MFTARFDVAVVEGRLDQVVAGDINGDGQMDVLSSTPINLGGGIRMHLNRSGEILEFDTFVIVSPPESGRLVMAPPIDIDGDGRLDLVVGVSATGILRWYRNLGGETPQFSAQPIDLAASAGAIELAIGDVNGDGRPDIIASGLNVVTLYESNFLNGVPFWSKRPIAQGSGFAGLAIADLNGDGLDDVLVAASPQSLWLAQSAPAQQGGTFAVRVLAPGIPSHFIAAADINGDGRVDAVSVEFRAGINSVVRWHENLGPAPGDPGGPPVFATHDVFIGLFEPTGLFVADVDKDGRPDILTASQRDDSIRLHRQIPVPAGQTPVFVTERITAGAKAARGVTAADVDGDGELDVVSASFADDAIRWYRNDRLKVDRVSFRPRVVEVPEFTFIHSAAAGDFDGDGRVDLCYASSNAVKWFRNMGDDAPSFEPRQITPIGAGSLFLSVNPAEIDGDGRLDILATSLFGSGLRNYMNTGAEPRFAGYELKAMGGVSHAIGADLTGDGRLDVIALKGADGARWLRNLGGSPPVFELHPLFEDTSATSHGVNAAAAADIDGDGDMDIVLCTTGLGLSGLGVAESSGGDTPTFTTLHDIAPGVLIAYTAVATGDLDGDGWLDVATGDVSGNVYWHRRVPGAAGGGEMEFVARRIHRGESSFRSSVSSVVITDLDEDGDLDIVTASEHTSSSSNSASNWRGGDPILWHENIGPADSAKPVGEGNELRFITHIASTEGHRGGWVADVNGDGQLDIVSPGNDGKSVLWHENLRPTFDLNADGVVDSKDLGMLLTSWGLCDPQAIRCGEDVNRDGVVDANDLALLLGAWRAR